MLYWIVALIHTPALSINPMPTGLWFLPSRNSPFKPAQWISPNHADGGGGGEPSYTAGLPAPPDQCPGHQEKQENRFREIRCLAVQVTHTLSHTQHTHAYTSVSHTMIYLTIKYRPPQMDLIKTKQNYYSFFNLFFFLFLLVECRGRQPF